MPSCSCVYMDRVDMPSFVKERYPIARVEHQCCECDRIMEIGERYEVISGVWDGSFSRFKTCLNCVSVREEFFCDWYTHGEIWEALGEHIRSVGGHVDGDCISRLTGRARGMVCDLIEETWV